MTSPMSLKRSYDDAGLEEPTPPTSSDPCAAPVDAKVHEKGSTQVHIASQSNGVLSQPNNPIPGVADGSTSDPLTHGIQSTKKHRLTFEEKEVKRVEKEFKAREKAEQKAKKEEEKAKKEQEKESERSRKEEEKKAKEAEREGKRKAKEEQAQVKQEEKRLKEETKRKQEDEKNRKSRNQLRLNAFFTQPSMSHSTSCGSPTHDAHSPLSSRRSSISEIQAMEVPRRSRSISTTPQKPQLSDYDREFKTFFIPSNTRLAPYNRFSRDKECLTFARKLLGKGLKATMEAEATAKAQDKPSILELLQLPPQRKRGRLPQPYSVKDIMSKIDGTNSRPIDLTGQQPRKSAKNPLQLLARIPMKSLKFAEDVRPPYIGTYTRLQSDQTISQLARNPFNHSLPDKNYDYDSEAEWEEPVEGEDLNSEGEEEAEDEEDGDDMAGFLDDEGSAEVARAVKRRPVLGNQEPVCSGICWEGPKGYVVNQGLPATDWRHLKLDVLMENPQFPIDPYSSTYWVPTTSSNPLQTTPHGQTTLMEPPRVPLHPINRQNALLSSSLPTKAPDDSALNSSAPFKPAKAKRQIASELMDNFKTAVQGNDLTKVGLLEVLKKKFPKEPKDAIRDTLEMFAERVGPTPSEKRWILKSGI